MEVNIHHAKTNLSRLILRAEAGEEVIIARAGKPAVKLVRVEAPFRKHYKPGALRGRLQVPADFLDPDPALEGLFYEESLQAIEASSPGVENPAASLRAKP
jgi:prevent-host-death family protein